nr:hypothetical protein [Tanacetum cinerariifolium]GFB31842.1 hypothetical protein [Tanacetum cinerariifolium]
MDVSAPTIVASLTFSALTLTPSTIPTISTVPQASTPPTTALSTLLQDLPNFASLFRFDHQLKTLEANFSDQDHKGASKEQDKVQVSKILPKIEKTVNKQLEAEVLTRSSNSSKTSYAIATDLSEMELKKILIKKMERNKDIVTLKRRHDDDANKDEEPSAGSDRGSKRRREGKERESTSVGNKMYKAFPLPVMEFPLAEEVPTASEE